MMFTDRSIIRSGYSMKKAQKAELPARASLDCIPNAYGTLQQDRDSNQTPCLIKISQPGTLTRAPNTNGE